MFVRPDASIDGSVVAVVSDTSYVSRPDPQSLFTPVSSRPPYQVRGKLRGGISLGVHQTGSFGFAQDDIQKVSAGQVSRLDECEARVQ